MPAPLHIDGSTGGGQILRTALSLSALTSKAFVIDHIRKRRSRPGLMRQHLAAVQATAQICGAEVVGGELHSTRLEFRPGAVRAGTYQFVIGTAGSAPLVLQTVLPPLMLADAPSQLGFTGGTHNPLAPPYPYLDQVFFPVLERMGVGLTRRLLRHGFHPAGGGHFEVEVRPVARLLPLQLCVRGARERLTAEALVANLPRHIGTRELAVVRARLGVPEEDLHLHTPEAQGPGNVLMIFARHAHATEMVTGFGERRVRAETVAERACDAMEAYLRADVPVGEHLADQLLIPFSLAGTGAFRTLPLSDHARSNMQVIQRFLPVRFEVTKEREDAVRVTVTQG